MNPFSEKIKLTEKDKKVLVKHSNICTEAHGSACTVELVKNKSLHIH